MLETFFHLRLRDELNIRSREKRKAEDDNEKNKRLKKGKQAQPYISKNQKKIRKQNEKVEKELREAEAQFTREECQMMVICLYFKFQQTETLKMVFIAYFRILKNATNTANAAGKLLPAALEGLAKFAHLISVDFFEDLLAALKKLMQTTQNEETIEEELQTRNIREIGLRNSLLCVITAFQLLSGQG